MAYSLDYQLNHDIDIFLKLSFGLSIHVASAGAILPEGLASLDKLIIENKEIILNLKGTFKVDINPALNQILDFRNNKERELYLVDFKRIASRGIVTFDKTIVENPNDPHYHVVAWPLSGNYFDYQFPLETPPDFISDNIQKNILENIITSSNNNKRYEKFELFRGVK